MIEFRSIHIYINPSPKLVQITQEFFFFSYCPCSLAFKFSFYVRRQREYKIKSNQATACKIYSLHRTVGAGKEGASSRRRRKEKKRKEKKERTKLHIHEVRFQGWRVRWAIFMLHTPRSRHIVIRTREQCKLLTSEWHGSSSQGPSSSLNMQTRQQRWSTVRSIRQQYMSCPPWTFIVGQNSLWV